MTSPVRRYALAGAILFALAACSKPEAQQMPTPEVGVVKATPQSVPLQRDLVGRLSAFRTSDVRARVPGVLIKRVYEEGSEVKEGQVLFQIDPAPQQASLSAAQANLASAQATYANAKVAADRARQLVPQKFVSQSDLDNAQAAERSAAAAVQQAQANVSTARINLGYTNVTAPISGRAGKQQVTEGALVGQVEATLLTTVDQIDPLYVNFSLGINELESLRMAQSNGSLQLTGEGEAKVQVILSDGSVFSEEGLLDFSGTVVDPATGAVSLRARIPNPEKSLLPGMFVTLKATLGERKNAFLIPQDAVLRDASGAYVLVVGADGKVVRKSVTAENPREGQWVVTSGLAANDQVIVSGVQKVQPGAPAKATPWKPAAPAGQQPAAAAAPQK
ncbi:efflux RND transporter periplasmic adaptor subunit [Pseudoxanthomonas sp. SL93]|uniref:efflux RND transporter periplasmic adaptor subunit n=1 Tax=Pseudoxanthomonas sp. SL93 TaxID=2995142 RepID=UPI00226E6EA0|nr:efflux RND transporter periplasmic adaptor subunit [Pseudoxanthomonas sp. SL93]WAC64175.1 efflux RND transporter periplasmic adaptor subunit [Pseudoxanthomonas sp. SL93]